MAAIRSPYLVRRSISSGTSRHPDAWRRHPVISVTGCVIPISYRAERRNKEERRWRESARRAAALTTQLIRDKFCAIESADKPTRGAPGTRKYDPRLVYETIDRRRLPTAPQLHTCTLLRI